MVGGEGTQAVRPVSGRHRKANCVCGCMHTHRSFLFGLGASRRDCQPIRSYLSTYLQAAVADGVGFAAIFRHLPRQSTLLCTLLCQVTVSPRARACEQLYFTPPMIRVSCLVCVSHVGGDVVLHHVHVVVASRQLPLLPLVVDADQQALRLTAALFVATSTQKPRVQNNTGRGFE